jgi:IS1 family transposase
MICLTLRVRIPNIVGMNRLSLQDRATILGCLVEGNSMRATSRSCGVSINTVIKLLIDVGAACDLYQNETLRNLKCKRIQCDEAWSFCYAKESLPRHAHAELGVRHVWMWTALDADTKLMVTWHMGRRNAEHGAIFMNDVAGRLKDRVQLTTDRHKVYLNAVAFRSDIDYAMLVGLYGNDADPTSPKAHYTPGECCGTIKRTGCGLPGQTHIPKSYIERSNLTMRMSMRRFTRLTNGFRKKLENVEAAVGLHFMYYNFGRIHKTLRVTPAMQAGVSDHVWTLKEIAKLTE